MSRAQDSLQHHAMSLRQPPWRAAAGIALLLVLGLSGCANCCVRGLVPVEERCRPRGLMVREEEQGCPDPWSCGQTVWRPLMPEGTECEVRDQQARAEEAPRATPDDDEQEPVLLGGGVTWPDIAYPAERVPEEIPPPRPRGKPLIMGKGRPLKMVFPGPERARIIPFGRG